MFQAKHYSLLLLASVALFALVLLLEPALIYRKTFSLDVASGRIREEHELFGIETQTRISDTDLSNEYAKLVGTSVQAQWRTVSVFGWGRKISPHYRFHGATAVMSKMSQSLRSPRVGPETRQVAVKTFFRLLQENQDIWPARRFADDFVKRVMDGRSTPILPEDVLKCTVGTSTSLPGSE